MFGECLQALLTIPGEVPSLVGELLFHGEGAKGPARKSLARLQNTE